MAVSLTSRYQRNDVGLIVDRHGALQRAILRRAPQAQTLRVSDHLWQAGDRVDLLGARYYGSETSWWMIAEANRAAVLDWTSPAPGTALVVPRGVA